MYNPGSAEREVGTIERSSIKPSMEELWKIYLETLQQLYYAQQKLLPLLSLYNRSAITSELKMFFEEEMIQTDDQVHSFERIFRDLRMQPYARSSASIHGLIEDGQVLLNTTNEGSITRDAAIIMGTKNILHYEISIFHSLVWYAQTLRIKSNIIFLEQGLQEKRSAEIRLANIILNWEDEAEPVNDQSKNLG